MYKGKTFIISGPSGVGKSTVLKELFEDYYAEGDEDFTTFVELLLYF